MDLLELEIGPVAHGGWCVARDGGASGSDGGGSVSAGGGTGSVVVFVRHALPGERVRARVVERGKRFLRAEAVEILAASPDRVIPPCPYAGPGRCGGCDWQHASSEAQLRLKSAVVEESLRRIAGISVAVKVEPLPLPPERPQSRSDAVGSDAGGSDAGGSDAGAADAGVPAWRTRVGFAVGKDGRVGFRRHRSHTIEPVERCLIAHPDVEALEVETNRWPGLDRVDVAVSGSTGDRVVHVDGPGRGQRVPRLAAPVRLVRGVPAAGRGLPYVREHAAGRTWRVSGVGFWQVHPGAPQALVDAVLEALAPRAGDIALDLYAGVGLFAGAIAPRVGPAGSVVAVEGDAIAARDARFNLRDLAGVRVERGRVDQLLARRARGRLGLSRADLVVVDPPRSGLGLEVVERIAGLAPRRVAYVSCDPATLARDLGWFAERGLELAGLRAYDAFPMTHHVECVATLAAVEG